MQASFSQNAESKQNGDDADDQLHHQEQHQSSQQAVNQQLNSAHKQRQQSNGQVFVQTECLVTAQISNNSIGNRNRIKKNSLNNAVIISANDFSSGLFQYNTTLPFKTPSKVQNEQQIIIPDNRLVKQKNNHGTLMCQRCTT